MRAVMSADVISSVRAEIGEGPLWDPRVRRVRWFDALRGVLHSTDAASGDTQSSVLGQAIGSVGLRARGGLIIAMQDGFSALDDELGLELLGPISYDGGTGRMNDGGCDAAGRFWAGTMEYDGAEGHGGLVYIDAARTVEVALDGLSLPNGIGWSPDGLTMYHTDSRARLVRAFDFDVVRGTLSRPRMFATIEDADVMPDGLTVDAEGSVWIALWGGGAIRRYDPGGRLQSTVRLPCRYVTSCAFGDVDLATLYITTAAFDENPAREERSPAGALFACRPGPTGKAAGFYGG